MNQNTLVTTYTQRSGINKTDADTNSQQYFHDGNSNEKQYFLLQFHKTVVGDLARKQVLQMSVHPLLVTMFEAMEITRVEQNKNNHNLSITHTVRFVTIPGLPCLQSCFSSIVTKISCKTLLSLYSYYTIDYIYYDIKLTLIR